ncbi:MAG TPA: hypothetical protein VFU32_09370 [Ktedonobacterales bacterium]|nr:hypothetical protein [Ktedonobacterales bacterium]
MALLALAGSASSVAPPSRLPPAANGGRPSLARQAAAQRVNLPARAAFGRRDGPR